MTVPVGRKGQIFLKKEAAYGTAEALVASNAMRHIEAALTSNPYNRVTSPEKKQSPGPVNRLDRKKTAELGSLVALLRPGGALNTLPEIDPILEAALGKLTNETLSTTVEAAPAPTTTGCTVASAGTLAIGDAVLITVSAEDKSPFVRILTGVSGAALTWDPALPAAPAAGEDLKGGITYQLTTDLAISLTIAHYLSATDKRAILGAGVDQLTLSFDANEEGRITAAGPAKEEVLRASVQAKPASFTTVGGNPPTGLIGDLYIDGTVYKFKTLEVAITNGIVVRNQEYGVNGGTEIYRQGRREITFSLESFVGDHALRGLAETGSNVTLLKQTGRTEGNIVAVYAPRVEFNMPEQDDPDEEVNYSFSGVALETADAQNDELTLAFL